MKEYKLIYADPAWHFYNWGADAPGMIHDRERGANKHYPTTTLEDMCRLDVPADKDAVLLVWGLSSHLKELITLTEAWGFTIKTKAWTWVKTTKDNSRPRIGMGYWTRQVSEDCWLATKGHPKAPKYRGEMAFLETFDLADDYINDTLYAPRPSLHSKKPEEAYDKINRLFPDVYPRLEMFARSAHEGWDVWGNEAPDSIHIPMKVLAHEGETV